MKQLEHLEKYVREPDTQFYGAYFYDGEDILLHDQVEEFKDEQENTEIKLTIKDTIENGIFKKYKKVEDLRTNTIEEIHRSHPVKKGDMLIFVMNEGFGKVKSGLITIDDAISRYNLIKGVDE